MRRTKPETVSTSIAGALHQHGFRKSRPKAGDSRVPWATTLVFALDHTAPTTPFDLTKDWTDIDVLDVAGQGLAWDSNAVLTPVDNPNCKLHIEAMAVDFIPANAADYAVMAEAIQAFVSCWRPAGGSGILHSVKGSDIFEPARAFLTADSTDMALAAYVHNDTHIIPTSPFNPTLGTNNGVADTFNCRFTSDPGFTADPLCILTLAGAVMNSSGATPSDNDKVCQDGFEGVAEQIGQVARVRRYLGGAFGRRIRGLMASK